jgi:hypothetical protein
MKLHLALTGLALILPLPMDEAVSEVGNSEVDSVIQTFRACEGSDCWKSEMMNAGNRRFE